MICFPQVDLKPHSHSTGYGHDHSHINGGIERKRLIFTICLTLVAMIVEVIGGFWTGSLALISDAGHMLTHLLALGVSLAAIIIASRPATASRTFGHHRAEVLAALFNGFTLLPIAVYIFYEAVQRVLNPQPIFGMLMLVIAVGGLIVNLVSALLLHGVSKDDLNVRSAFFHMLGDTLSSVAVIIGAGVIWLTGWVLIDPILSVLICLLIVIWAWRLIKESVSILMENAPAGIEIEKIKEEILGVCGKQSELKDLHVWLISSNKPVLAANIGVPGKQLPACSQMLTELKQILSKRFGIAHSTIQFESSDGA